MSKVDETTQAMAAAIWAEMDDNEKTGVRFGMFPAGKIRDAEAKGFNGKDICSALMDCAQVDGGMRA